MPGAFPSGATISFGYLESERDKYRYQSSELQFIGFDELTEFAESQYLYLFSRLRRRAGCELPLRMRSASNPGGLGHEWVRARFIDASDPECIFIPARLLDNPFLDQREYRQSLARLDPLTRAQLLEGDWQVRPEGAMFKRGWLSIVEVGPGQAQRVLRYWDKAASPEGGARSAGVRIAKSKEGLFYVEHVVAGRWSALERERIIRQTAEADGRDVSVWIEQEPGSGGKESAEATVRNLAGFSVRCDRVTGDKVTRAQPFAAQAEAGNVRLVRGPWNQDYLQELCAFPLGVLKDQVDASSGAFNMLATPSGFSWTEEDFRIYARDGR